MNASAHGETAVPGPTPARRLTRRREGRWFAGVAGGLGEHFGIDPLVFRIGFGALVLAGGGGILLYLAAWLVIPEEGAEDSIAVELLRERRNRPWALAGLGVVALAVACVVSGARVWPELGGSWIAAAVIGAGLLWWRARERLGRRNLQGSMLPIVAGVMLAGAGLLGLLSALGTVDVDGRVALAAGAALAGVGVVAGLLGRRRVSGTLLLGLALLAVFGVAAVARVPVSAGIGDRVERPLLASDVSSRYQLGVGDLRVDLRGVDLPPGTTHVAARLGVGDLRVWVPADARIEVRGQVRAGHADLFGLEDDGTQVSRHLVEPAARGESASVLVLDAFVGIGNLQVER